jgi:hypothetical protein
MRIAIDIDGVLRDTFTKIEQIYQKYFIDELELVDDEFNYEIITPYDTPEYSNHFKFKTDEEYLSFMYEEFAMEIFGHSPSTEMSTFYDLNDLIVKYKDKVKFLLISKQVGKTKPATLFFVSKFGCEIDKIIFYNQLTKDSVWNEFDILLTSNPDLIEQSKNKTLIKYETSYNLTTECDETITTLKEFDKKIETLIEK